MREIKFRAWCQESHFPTEFDQMLYSEKYTSLADLFSEVERARQDGAKVTVMQFTGLHDKNTKEVFEGDILSCGHGQIVSVEWGEQSAGWCISLQMAGEPYREPLENRMSFEVIGNVWENPELINTPKAD